MTDNMRIISKTLVGGLVVAGLTFGLVYAYVYYFGGATGASGFIIQGGDGNEVRMDSVSGNVPLRSVTTPDGRVMMVPDTETGARLRGDIFDRGEVKKVGVGMESDGTSAVGYRDIEFQLDGQRTRRVRIFEDAFGR